MGMKRKKRAPRRRGWLLGSSATQVICISFVLLIALGTLLLTLPISSRSGRLGVVDAMFTATSATCVTGLVVRDTWTQFTPFGQAVVLLLIQVGGLGLVTLTSFFALAAKRRMGFKDLRLLGESVSASGYSQATDVLKIVVKLAMTFEIIGMVLLMIAFVPQVGAEGIRPIRAETSLPACTKRKMLSMNSSTSLWVSSLSLIHICDHLCRSDPDHAQRGAGPGRLCHRRPPH